MSNKLVALKTIFKKKENKQRVILDQEQYEIEINNHYGNSKKADIIFSALSSYETTIDEDCDMKKYDFEKVHSISISHSMITYDEPYYPYNYHKSDTEGYEIFNTHIDTVIMLECYTYDNKIIRLDFKGHTDASGNGYYTYFDYNIKSWSQYLTTEEMCKNLIDKIKLEEDNIIELSASPLYECPKNEFSKESGLQPQGDFAYMIEFFSASLVCQDDDKYIGCFSEHDYNGKYIRDAMALINSVEKRAKELEDKYFDKEVKVTVSDFNEGCQYGMAVYVWIPYQ